MTPHAPEAGRIPDAIEAARAALELLARGEKETAGLAALLLAEALLLAGDHAAAVRAAEEAIDLSARSLRADFEARAPA